MKVLVVGATGGTGRAAVKALLEAGHEVTAFSRHADELPAAPRLHCVNGDATRPADVEAAVRDQDAVIVALGITENPIRVRLFGSRGTPLSVRSAGTRTVIQAMRRHSVNRLVALTSFGVGETRDKLRLVDRLVFGLLLKPQIRDTEEQEKEVRRSGLDWVIAQPVHLTDALDAEPPFLSPVGTPRNFKVARQQVARFLAASVQDDRFVGQSVAVSG